MKLYLWRVTDNEKMNISECTYFMSSDTYPVEVDEIVSEALKVEID